MLDKLTSADFAAYLHQPFRIRLEGMEPLETELIEVTELGEAAPGRRRAFSLIFRGPRQIVLPQQIYPLEHKVMGALDLFLVPIGPDQAGMRYEAIFT
ncbi:MAG: hypothetical protein Fur0044_03980 [Anaerolineae bacterium]|nr:hypothetical protein [Anaerolineales bacterium]MCQ3973907.1 hypothetical protein [Anaerolineae bacterium]